LLFANNVVYNPGATMKLGTTGNVTSTTVIGNQIIMGPNATGEKPIQIRAAGADALPAGSKVYLEDNLAPGATDDPWSIAGAYAVGGDIFKYRTTTPPAWPASFTRLSVDNSLVKNSVLKNVGARPADRDAVDQRIVDGVKNGTGHVINCVAANGTARCALNAGGYPALASNRRTLTPPASPNTVGADGYTNLELWLHKMSAQVEGRTGNSPPVSPQLVSVK
jgi:hypothetical protein